MLKKLLIILAALMPFALRAQLAVGGWTVHSPYVEVNTMEETEVYLYYMSEGSLFRVDKETTEVQTLNNSNLLNDGSVKAMYVARDCKSVLITYVSGNMDRIYDNGRVANISDIRDAVLTKPRNINHVDFSEKNFYVATDFGMVIYDSGRNEVVRTIYSDTPVKNVVALDDYVGIYLGNNTKMLFAKNDGNFTSLKDMFELEGDAGNYAWVTMKGVNRNHISFINIYSNTAHLHNGTVDLEARTFSYREVREHGTSQNSKNFHKSISVCPQGVYSANDKGTYLTAWDGSQTYLPGIVRTAGNTMSYFDDSSRAWRADASGVSCVDVASGDAIISTAKPSKLTVAKPMAKHIGKSGKVYFYNLGEQLNFGFMNNKNGEANATHINVMNGAAGIEDVSPADVQLENKNSLLYSPAAPHPVTFGYRMFEDPSDPEAYYIGSFHDGCYRVKNGVQTHKYYKDNSKLTDFSSGDYAYSAAQPVVDGMGNLWIMQYAPENGTNASIIGLPADKRLSDNVQKSDWKTLKPYLTIHRDCFGFASEKPNLVYFMGGYWDVFIAIINNKNTASLDDDAMVVVRSFVDQDNKSPSFNHILSAVEDKKGRLWVGTDNGVFEITDPSKVTQSTATINHLKVPRNDGTNLADYLLDTQAVYDISVDSSNRKWIATTSGVYLVSENGDAILEHYTTDNSVLPSNTVYSVACDPLSNSVFMGTDNGVVEYSSTSSPAQQNYDNVVAYPNPVRPEYSGWITISGLMENSMVKIADAAGNVFHQGRSNGGMYVWDGCNADGSRVKTGVYYVFASSGGADDSAMAGSSSSACVTKIMVVN